MSKALYRNEDTRSAGYKEKRRGPISLGETRTVFR